MSNTNNAKNSLNDFVKNIDSTYATEFKNNLLKPTSITTNYNGLFIQNSTLDKSKRYEIYFYYHINSIDNAIAQNFITNINNDNIKELYITSSPLKGDDYATVKDVGIFGYTLKNNKVARIYAENQDTDQNYTDKVTLKNNVLTRTYIINQKESSFSYNLDFTGDKFILTPQRP